MGRYGSVRTNSTIAAFITPRDGEEGHNYLCAGLEEFFMHTGPTFTAMAQLIHQGNAPAEVMATVNANDRGRGPYALCPCGSGEKFRFCHGPKAPASPFTGVRQG